jgi:adenosylmethionine-8-amino-7-oxononanoate aminotransferase
MGLDSDLSAIRAYDNVHWFHPWENLPQAGQQNRTIVTRGDGIYITDEQGRKLIDGPGGMWCVQVGYGNSEIAMAIAEQAMAMPYNNPFGTASSPAARLARKIAELAPGDLDHVFFTTGGSTAVDTAARFVHFYNNLRGKPTKKIILAREDSYHGSTYLTASLSGKVGNKGQFDHDARLVDFLPSANHYRFGKGRTQAQFCDDLITALSERIRELGAENIGAFIAEPIQASGGVIVAPEGYLKRTYDICKEHDILYISDEVVTGFGRLGHWFASKEVFGIEPDIITCAKGLTSGYQPLGAAIFSKRLYAEITNDNAKNNWFSNGFTYSGHPVSAACALKNIEVFERTGLLEHVRKVAPLFQSRMRALKSIPIVGDVRGMGLVGCVDCRAGTDDTDPWNPKHKIGARIDRHCVAMGLLVRPIINMCVFSPPLIITESQIDEMFTILEKGLKATMDELVREGVWKG